MGTRNFWKSADCAPPFAPGRGHRDIFGGDSPAPPPPPDYTPMAQASDKAAQLGYDLGQQQLAESRSQYARNMATAQPVIDAQLGLMNQTQRQGDDYYNYMVQNQRPVEQELNRIAMQDTSAQEAAVRAGIQGQYNQMRADAEAGRRGIMDRYDQNAAQDVAGRNQILATRTGGADRAAQMQEQMYGLSGTNAAANAAQRQQMLNYSGQNEAAQAASRGQMLDLSGQNDAANAAQRQQMLDLRNQGYSQADAVRLAMAQRAGANDIANADERALISGGDTGIYNARQGDIEAGVGRAVSDARTGQAGATNQIVRQALRYGYSPNKLAAMAAAQGLGQGSQIAAAANAARQQGITANRGYLQQGYDLRNQATDQYMNYAGADRNAILQNYENQAGAIGANADQRNAAYAQRYGALGDVADRSNAAFTQRYGALGAAYDQGNAAYQQQYGAMDANRLGYLQDADLRAAALGTAYDQRNATNQQMLQGLTNNRQMGMDQGQLGIQGAMNTRLLAQQDAATGWAKKLDVAGLYRGLPGASQGAYGLSTNAGNAAVGNTMQPGGQLLTGMAQGAGQQQLGAGQQLTGLGSVLNAQTSYNNMVAQQNQANQQASAQGMAGLGNLVGTIGAAGIKAGWFSDRRLKENIVQVGVDEFTGLPLYEFNYRGSPDNRFRGVMSDDVREVMPDAVYRINGYDKVNYSMLGIEMVEV